MTAADLVFDEIRVASTNQAISSLRALSDHEHLHQIPSRLRVEAKELEPNLSVHQFLQHVLRQIRLCSQCCDDGELVIRTASCRMSSYLMNCFRNRIIDSAVSNDALGK